MAPKQPPIDSLLHRCKYTMGKVQRMYSELSEELELDRLPPPAVINVRLENLQRYQKAYNDLHADILERCPSDQFAEYDEQLDEFEEVCSSIRIQIESITIATKEEKPAPGNSAQVIVHQQPLQVPMPKFDGSYEQWPKFKAMFTDIMSRSRDSDAIKLHHLNQALVGQAAGILNASIITDNNFATAWKLLETRYENPRVIVEAHINGLLNMKKVERESAKDLRALAETCTRHVDGLNYMKHGLDSTSNLIVTKLLTSCFDAETRKLWERTLEQGEFPELQKTLRFLTTQCEVLERCDAEYKPKLKAKAYPAVQNVQHEVTKPSCIMCHGEHKIGKCLEFLQLSVSNRFTKAKQAKLCINCLSSGHLAADCKSKWTCNKCRGRHHSLLHIEKAENTETSKHAPHQGALSLQCSGDKVSSTVLLSTVLLLVRDKGGRYHEARALLDSGSQLNFMSDRLAQVLRLHRVAVHIPVVGIGEAAANSVQQEVTATVSSRTSNYLQTMRFAILPKPTTDLPISDIDITRWKLPPGIVLADPTYHISGKVDIILGAEHFVEVIRDGKITVAVNQPMLLETEFGWVVSGRSTQRVYNAVSLPAISIEQLMQKFYEIEEVSSNTNWSLEEAACETHYRDTTTRDVDGKYVVQLPRKTEMVDALGESKSNALRRFLAIERKLQRDPATYAAYREFMDEYISLGHMSITTEEVNRATHVYYLPHHAVFKADSTTTKCRVVFDASAKTSTGVSLNDTLMVGPTIQQDASTILTRFRTYSVAITADIAKMYRQIWIHPKDRSLQRILWRSDPSKPIQTYELNTVTYGTASAPYLAIRSLLQTVEDHGKEYPTAAARFDDFYVDDFISGDQSVEAATRLQMEAEGLFAKGGFTLRKWASNQPSALQGVAKEELDLMSLLGKDLSLPTLGLIWKPSSDTIHIKFNVPELPHLVTKRIILSCIAKIYDPLGLIDPIKATAKQIMQTVWALKSEKSTRWGWDDELPQSIQQTWHRFQNQLNHLQDIEIPRVAIGLNAVNIQLHFFCDASERGYGACCYVRTSSSNGETTSRLLVSKSKVAPLATKHSIARLELCAANLAGQLYLNVVKALNLTSTATFWTDSMTVYHWLQSSPSRWKTFVANRVSQIQQATAGKQWRHVPGVDNPADLVSRGCMGADLIQDKRWWQGPNWLTLDEDKWPQAPTTTDLPIATAEEKVIVASCTVSEAPLQYIFTRYSSLSKLRKMVGYWMQYMNRLANKKQYTGSLSIEDLTCADQALCRLAQAEHFKAELKALKRNEPIPRSSPMKWFNPILSADGIIRVGGRLRHSAEPENLRHPIIIPGKHPLATLLVHHYHLKLLHAGPQLMLNTIRQQYWIVGGRDLIRKVYRRCHTCFRCRPPLSQALMADLPSERVTEARPFSISGVDYCGPVYVKGKHRKAVPTKAFVAIFVCFATRAVHLELVSDLSTEAFLAALRRFVGRRGLVSELQSDNGTNFKGAANALTALYKLLQSSQHQQAVQSWTIEKGIKWKFIPPRAPHFGGLWEAAVRSMKHHLVRVVGTSSFSFEDMATLLAEIECCLNSRPITALSDDPTDMEALTPGHFLTGSNMQLIPEMDTRDVPENRLNHWQQVKQRARRFWDRWHVEYLQKLQTRSKWNNPGPSLITPGQLVIIREDNIPSTRWPLGRIVKVHPGKDGVVRVVTIRTAKADEVVRPIVKICVLPASS